MTIRLAHSLALARMLLRFFTRKVFNLGPLRSRAARVVALGVVVGLVVVCAFAAYAFLAPIATDAAAWRLLFDTATVSLLLWVQIAFLFVKTLFIGADGMLEMSFQLPLTNRERSTAFMLYEVTMTAVVVATGFFALAFTSVLLLGVSALPLIVESIVLPISLAYLGLTVIYLGLQRILELLRLRAIQNVALVLVLFTVLLVYGLRMPALISGTSSAYLGGQDPFVWVTGIAWLSRHHGAPLTWIGALLALLVLARVALWLTPAQHVRHSRYLDVWVGGWLRRRLTPYDWCLLRSSQTALSVALAAALFGYLCVRPGLDPLWGLAVLSLTGLYQFAATAPLRGLVGAPTSPWRVYGQLVRAQLILLGLIAVPATAIAAALGRADWADSATALLGCAGGATMAVCIGVLFPAEKDNPFSVFMGVVTAALVGALIALALGLLQLPPPAVYAVLVGASAVFVLFTVQGIHTHHARSRNEAGSVGHHVRPGRRAVDAGHGGRDVALHDVLDR